MRASVKDHKIVVEYVMKMNGPSTTNPPTDTWVFDDFVVLRLRSGTFYFYEKPMVVGFTKSVLPQNETSYSYSRNL